MNRCDSAGTFAAPLPPRLFFFIACPALRSLQHQFLFGRLEIVVVPQLLAGDDLAEGIDTDLRRDVVEAELSLEPCFVDISHGAPHRIDAEARGLAGDIDRAVIHGIAKILASVAADNHAAPLHHEAGEGAGVAADDDGATFHVDAGARADIALAHEVAAADGRAELRAGVLLDEDGAAHHVLGTRPADPARDAHVGAVDEAQAEIAERAIDDEIEAIKDTDGDRMLGAGVLDDDGAVAFLHQFADAEIDILRRHV